MLGEMLLLYNVFFPLLPLSSPLHTFSNSQLSLSTRQKAMDLYPRTMSEADNIDLERCMTDSINKQTTGCHPIASPKADRQCTIAIQRLDGRATLINATIKEVNGDLVFNSAKQQIVQALHPSWHQRITAKLFTSLDAGTATIRQVTSRVLRGYKTSCLHSLFFKRLLFTMIHHHHLPPNMKHLHLHHCPS